MNRSISIYSITLVCCLVLVLASCSGKRAGHENTVDTEVEKLNCLVVMPTRTTVATTKDMKYANAEALEKGAGFLDSIIADELNGSQVSRIIAAEQVAGMPTEVSGGNLGMLKAIGGKLNCNAIFVPTVQRYKQRVGGEYAVDSPASAAFEMRLIDVNSGSVFWAATFSETQESLLNNLFSFDKAKSRGFKWITVEELVRQGVQERLSQCPYLF